MTVYELCWKYMKNGFQKEPDICSSFSWVKVLSWKHTCRWRRKRRVWWKENRNRPGRSSEAGQSWGAKPSPSLPSEPVLPARFKAFQLLHKEGLQHLRTLKEGGVVGVVVATVVENFGHICHELRELLVMSLLQMGFHGGEICGSRNGVSEARFTSFCWFVVVVRSYPLVPWWPDNNLGRRGDPPALGKATPFCVTATTTKRFKQNKELKKHF